MKKKLNLFVSLLIIIVTAFITLSQYINLQRVMINYEGNIVIKKLQIFQELEKKYRTNYALIDSVSFLLDHKTYNYYIIDKNEKKTLYQLGKEYSDSLYNLKIENNQKDGIKIFDDKNKRYILAFIKNEDNRYLFILSDFSEINKIINNSIKNQQVFFIGFLIVAIIISNIFLTSILEQNEEKLIINSSDKKEELCSKNLEDNK